MESAKHLVSRARLFLNLYEYFYKKEEFCLQIFNKIYESMKNDHIDMHRQRAREILR